MITNKNINNAKIKKEKLLSKIEFENKKNIKIKDKIKVV